ncbi:MAG: hypothetical protein HRT74_04150 [Flavobacteriales bacterium]|nr:hypothetical protein [Flavobacteriales bacterium]
MKRVLLAMMVTLCILGSGFAQKDSVSFSLGYFAPYGIQVGGKVGTTIPLQSWDVSGNELVSHHLRISPQIGYFFFPEVQHNFFGNVETSVLRVNSKKRLAPFAGIGLGYIVARQRQGGSVHLGTGEITYDVKTIGYFTPTLNIGFEILPKNWIGYYVKGFYGGKFTSEEANSAIFGLEFGVSAFINPQQSKG